jgi:4'-phosphopantetheinyl transferase
VWSLDVPDIGVDIESLNREVRQPAMAKHTLTTWEMQQWERAGQSHDYWMKMWTIKEAVLKASGLGIRLSLNELNTHCLPEQQQGVVSHPQIGHWCYQCFMLDRHILTVSWPEGTSSISIDIKKPA